MAALPDIQQQWTPSFEHCDPTCSPQWVVTWCLIPWVQNLSGSPLLCCSGPMTHSVGLHRSRMPPPKKVTRSDFQFDFWRDLRAGTDPRSPMGTAGDLFRVKGNNFLFSCFLNYIGWSAGHGAQQYQHSLGLGYPFKPEPVLEAQSLSELVPSVLSVETPCICHHWERLKKRTINIMNMLEQVPFEERLKCFVLFSWRKMIWGGSVVQVNR